MLRRFLSILTAFLLLPAFAVQLAPWSPDAVGTAPVRVSVREVVGEGTREFDESGKLLSASNAVARAQFTYDVRDRLIAATTRVAGESFPLTWRRDAGGLVTNLVYAAGRTVEREYDLRGRLTAVRDWFGYEWTFTHDGQLSGIVGAGSVSTQRNREIVAFAAGSSGVLECVSAFSKTPKLPVAKAKSQHQHPQGRLAEVVDLTQRHRGRARLSVPL